MEQNENTNKINWHIGIPIALWIICVILGILKVTLKAAVFDKGVTLDFVDVLNAFNSNTFSTFISVVACMLYQHYSTENVGFKRETVSGLSMRRMPAIIIISGIYIMLAAFDSALSLFPMSVIFFITNIVYVICFFTIFRAKKTD